MTTRKQRSRAQHLHDLAVVEARRQVSAVVAETAPAPRTRLPEVEGKPSAPRLTYPGDRRGVDPAFRYGPDRFGCYYLATSAVYDAASDRTVLWFTPMAPRRAA